MSILLDFAGHYSFVVQDAMQRSHSNNIQATLHPFVAYYLNGNNLVSKIFCVISDEMKHDTLLYTNSWMSVFPRSNEFRQIWSNAITLAMVKAPNIKSQELCNLSDHKADFGVDDEWNFFAISHGKSPCDGIGGTVKRLVARACL